MTIRAKKFTPEVLLGAPRRSAAVPNHDGTLALFSVSTYSFGDHTTAKEIRIMDLRTGKSVLFSNDAKAHDAKWLGDGTNAIIWLQSGEKSITNIMIGEGDEPAKASYVADVLSAPFQNLKLKMLHDGSIACVMSCLATPEGSLYNEDMVEKPASSARIYDKFFVRFWDKYKTPERNTLWYSKLVKSDDKYSLAAPMCNALKGTSFECPFYYPIFDELNAFDIGTSGIIFSGTDRDENPALEGQGLARVYFIPLSSFTESEATKPIPISSGKNTGSTTNPRISPCGSKAAFLVPPDPDSLDNRIIVTENLKFFLPCDVLAVHDDQPYDVVPESFEWAQDGNSLYVTAESCGRVSLFSLSLGSGKTKLERLTQEGVVSAFYPLQNSGEKLLVSSTTMTDNSIYSIMDCSEPENSTVISSNSKHGLKFGISQSQVSEIYFEGAGDYCVQAFVIKPSFFDESKKYPLAMLIHGGPQSAWNDGWSTRWNPVVWAEQGYVVVTPNPCGSTGFGLELTDAINGEWGGRCYQDIVNCFHYVKENMPFVDTDNAIAAGGSFGGYMANWIQGNSLGRRFKALVCHDGVFDTQNMIIGDTFEGKADFKGPMLPWKNYKNLQKWNPARPDLLANWKTPMLVIHSDLDYRCEISWGLAAFAVLQASGIPSKYLTFPDENHWVLKPENSLVWHKTVFDWINKYSGITKKREEEEKLLHGREHDLLVF